MNRKDRTPSRKRWMRTFLAMNSSDRNLCLEAACLLVFARIVLLIFPFKWLPGLVRFRQEKITPCQEQLPRAQRASWAVRTVAPRIPLRLLCLPQAIALKWMLNLRSIRSVMRFGVKKGSQEGFKAHAWVLVDDTPVIGRVRLRDYSTIASFD